LKSIAQDNNKSGVVNNTNGKEPVEDRNTAPKKLNTPDRDMEIIMDYHGNGMRASKLYKNRNVKLTVLGPGKKNIQGAREFVTYITPRNTKKNIVLGIGSNGLSNSTADRCISDMKDLLSHCKEKHPSASIHVLPAFERVNEGNFNGRVKLVNEEIKAFCAKDHNYEYIENRLIFSHNKSVFQQNGIHFTVTGQKCLARILKSHLNPKLGLRPYMKNITVSVVVNMCIMVDIFTVIRIIINMAVL
jgi:hypothetical protein